VSIGRGSERKGHVQSDLGSGRAGPGSLKSTPPVRAVALASLRPTTKSHRLGLLVAVSERAEIWTVAGGSGYAGKPRPAVIIQDDRFDTDSVTICPFTTDPTDARCSA